MMARLVVDAAAGRGTVAAARATAGRASVDDGAVSDHGELAVPARFGPEPPPVPSPSRGWAVPAAAAVLVLVVLGAGAAWLRTEDDEVPDDVPLLVAEGVRDDFTRAESPTPLEVTRTGQPWEQVSGRWEVEDGVARLVERNDLGARTVAITEMETSDGAVAVTAASMTDGVGVAFRYQDAFNYWFVTAVPSFGSWRIDRLEDGELVEVGGLPLVEAVDGSTLEVRFEGRTITVFVDGEQQQEVTDPALGDATGVGLVFTGGRPEVAAWDDLVAVPISAPASASVDPS
jgi:hypothetical protein